jgi:hypothetical protein
LRLQGAEARRLRAARAAMASPTVRSNDGLAVDDEVDAPVAHAQPRDRLAGVAGSLPPSAAASPGAVWQTPRVPPKTAIRVSQAA